MHIHGKNITTKELSLKKYSDEKSKVYINEIKETYNIWKDANLKLEGPHIIDDENDYGIIEERVRLFNEYKDFLDQQHYAEAFDSRSNLHSSVLEEFLYFLFKDLIKDFSENALIGKSHAFKDLFFQPTSFQSMLEKPTIKVEKKDHDFTIGVIMNVTLQNKGSEEIINEVFELPAVAIECKTYIDKTMLEASSNAAEQLLFKNPNSIYIIVAEWVKLTDKVNLKKYKTDKIYILRKQKNTDREFRYIDGYLKNPIYADVVFNLFKYVKDHLTNDWSGGVNDNLASGILK